MHTTPDTIQHRPMWFIRKQADHMAFGSAVAYAGSVIAAVVTTVSVVTHCNPMLSTAGAILTVSALLIGRERHQTHRAIKRYAAGLAARQANERRQMRDEALTACIPGWMTPSPEWDEEHVSGLTGEHDVVLDAINSASLHG